jgi:putative YpdA family bacillithiol system oxidoreductase
MCAVELQENHPIESRRFVSASAHVYDILIIGAGPVGLACGIEAANANLDYLILEKGCLTNSIFHFPSEMQFFSTPELLEIGGVPFVISKEKPSRQDCLNYYRRLAEAFKLRIQLFEKVEKVTRQGDRFEVKSSKNSYSTGTVIIATGFYDHYNPLDIPGEQLSKVSHYYTAAHPFFRRRVAIIGGKNSAVEAALDLYRHGAEVTIIHRGDDFGKSVKYWILPDVQNRVKEGAIKAMFKTRVTRITDDAVYVTNGGAGEQRIDNDFVFALTGYHPDYDFLHGAGISIDGQFQKPSYNPETFETNVPSLYIAGVAAAGKDGNSIFIENGREHAKKIVQHIATKRSS